MSASAGGQLEHPSEVKSSSTTGAIGRAVRLRERDCFAKDTESDRGDGYDTDNPRNQTESLTLSLHRDYTSQR